MSILFPFPENDAGMLVITFCDRANNQFVDLAAFSFPTAAEFDAAWASVPEAPDQTAFLVDRHTAEGHDADRYVTAEWIEARCGRAISDLIASGRSDLSQWMADWKASSAKTVA